MGRSFTPSGGAGTPFEGQELLSAFTCPPLPASVNDYTVNQRGFVNASVLLVGATTAINMTGLQGATPNRELLLLNVSASAITLKNANAGSAAANRFNLGGADVVLNQFGSAKLIGAGGAWALQGAPPPSGGGGAPSTDTFVTATDQTATLPNSVILGIAENASPAGTFSGAAAHSNANQTLATGVLTNVIFGVTDFDTDTYFDGVSAMTAPRAGFYLASTSIFWATNASTRLLVNFTINGSANLFGVSSIDNAGGTFNAANTLCIPLKLAASDVVRVNAVVTTGSTNDIIPLNSSTTFSLIRLA